MPRMGRLLDYLGGLTAGKAALWCYLIWYLCTVVFYFDTAPAIWLNALGISAVVGIALQLGVSPSASLQSARWQSMRLFLTPFCVSTFSSLTKGRGFLLILPPKPAELLISVAACTAFVALVVLAKAVPF